MPSYPSLEAVQRGLTQVKRILHILESVPDFPQLSETSPNDFIAFDDAILSLRHNYPEPNLDDESDPYLWSLTLTLRSLVTEDDGSRFASRIVRLELANEDTYIGESPSLRFQLDMNVDNDTWSFHIWRESDDPDGDSDERDFSETEAALVRMITPTWDIDQEESIQLDPYRVENAVRAMAAFYLEHYPKG